MTTLPIIRPIVLDEADLVERFITSSGPGGQNVNKVASAVELRFDALHSRALTEAVRARLRTLAGRRMTQDGVVVITAQRFRTQERNRADARERLATLLHAAATPPVYRVPTRPTLGSKRRRLEDKGARAGVKRDRGRPDTD